MCRADALPELAQGVNAPGQHCPRPVRRPSSLSRALTRRRRTARCTASSSNQKSTFWRPSWAAGRSRAAGTSTSSSGTGASSAARRGARADHLCRYDLDEATWQTAHGLDNAARLIEEFEAAAAAEGQNVKDWGTVLCLNEVLLYQAQSFDPIPPSLNIP